MIKQLSFILGSVFLAGHHLHPKGPDWWCYAEDAAEVSYLGFGVDKPEACAEALKKCKEATSSSECTTTDSGEW